MSKPTKPDVLPLEPTPTEKRKMLIAGVADFDAKVKPETPEEAVDNFIAKRSTEETAAEVVQAIVALKQDEDDFDWNNPDEESIVLREQRATAVYRNRLGELIIRQQVWPDEDSFIYVTPENVTAFLEATAKRARET